jgi:hypothetical protein
VEGRVLLGLVRPPEATGKELKGNEDSVRRDIHALAEAPEATGKELKGKKVY